MADSSSTLDETFWGGQGWHQTQYLPTWAFLYLRVTLITHLEGHTAHRQVATVLEEGKVLGHQGGCVYHALRSLCMVAQLGMFASHVLQPCQPQVWRALVPPGNSGVQNSRDMSTCLCLPSPNPHLHPFTCQYV